MSLTSLLPSSATYAQQKRDRWEIITLAGILLFSLNSVIFAVLGQVNADEGWYLYASKLVYAGKLPYKDFAFTQMPLLPFIYGIAQNVFFQSLYLGRITSILFSSIAFLLSIKIAKTYGGPVAGSITSLLGGTFTYGIYFQTLTKTYALTTFFFVLVLFVLSSTVKQDLKWVYSSSLLLLATLTRLSSLFFSVPFLVYGFISSNARKRLAGIAIACALLLPMLVLSLQNIDATLWGLFGHHTSGWNQTGITERLISRLPALIAWTIREFFGYVLLWGVVLWVNFRRARELIKDRVPIFLTMAASILVMIPNLISDGFQPEYFVPILFISFPILGILYGEIHRLQWRYSKILVSVLLVYTLISGLVQGLRSYIDLSGGKAPIEEIRHLASLIKENSEPADQIFALEGLLLAVESGRSVLPNLEMAQFSFYEMETETASHLHLLNSEMVWKYLETAEPKIVVLTDLDEDMLIDSPHYAEIRASLEKNYSLLYRVKENFGQRREGVKVYSRRSNGE